MTAGEARDPRALRTRAVWLLVIPFFWFSSPTLPLIATGCGFALVGLLIRAWAAGTIRKDAELTTSGPYAFLRHPLYAGSFFVGVGVTFAGGHWLWPMLFLAFFAYAYGRTLAYESGVLRALFGEPYEVYRAAVPALIPRIRPFRPDEPDGSGGFSVDRYMRNNEWEALLGTVAAFAILAAKASLTG